MTVLQLVEKYLLLKRGVKHNTEANYKTIVNYLKTDAFSQTRKDNVKTSDAQEWLIKLQDKNDKSYSSIHSIRGVLRPAFQMAVNDDYIRKNPFDFPRSTVLYNDSVKRDAISKADEKRFLTFIKNDDYYCKYFEGIYILFKTGLRISEFVGLTLKDINLKEKNKYKSSASKET